MKYLIALPGQSRYRPTSDEWMSHLGPSDYQRLARAFERLGYHEITCAEHLALDSRLVADMGAYWFHAMAAMSFCAGATERIRVGSGILILPLYHPVNLAKAVSTLDVLSGGRVTLGVGLGHGEAEFAALGVPYAERGRIADEYLEAMAVLWTEERPSYRGRFVAFEGIAFEPKPVQRPGPPIWVGGNSLAALRRAAKYGAGWCPWQIGLEELPEWLARLDGMPEGRARTAPLEVSMPAMPMNVGADHKPLAGSADGKTPFPSSDELVDRIGRLEEAGVTRTTLPLVRGRSLEEYLDELERLCGPVLRQTTG